MEHNLIFTLSGAAQAGKDTCAEMIKIYCNNIDLSCFKLAFADPVKYHCARNFGYEDKETGRHILQDFGTKVRGIEKDFWMRQTFITIDMLRSLYDVFVISDCRYENEMQPYPFSLCYPIINIYVKRDFDTPLGVDEYNHESEAMAHNPDLSKFHYVIDNNGSLDDTYNQIANIVNDVIDKQLKFLNEQRKISEELALESSDLDVE